VGILFTFFGTLMIGGVIGFLSEKWGLTHYGYLSGIIIATGGVVLMFMLSVMFRIGFGSAGLNAVIGAVAALIIVPKSRRR